MVCGSRVQEYFRFYLLPLEGQSVAVGLFFILDSRPASCRCKWKWSSLRTWLVFTAVPSLSENGFQKDSDRTQTLRNEMFSPNTVSPSGSKAQPGATCIHHWSRAPSGMAVRPLSVAMLTATLSTADGGGSGWISHWLGGKWSPYGLEFWWMGQKIQRVLIQPHCPGPGCLPISPAVSDYDGLKPVSIFPE